MSLRIRNLDKCRHPGPRWIPWLLLGLGGFIPAAWGQGPRPVIEISADIYEYRLDGEKQLGIFYQYNRQSGSIQNSDIFLPGSENVKEKAIGALDISGSFAKLSYGTIDYNIKTAIEEGRATVISNQRLITADGEPVLRVSGVFKMGTLIGDGQDRDPLGLRPQTASRNENK